MSRVIIAIICFTLIHSNSALSDTDEKCIQTYNGTLNNDYLLGAWFRTYKWGFRLDLPPSADCQKLVFARPSPQELQEYKDFYNDPSRPYNLDDNALLYEQGKLFNGLITGHNEVKFRLRPVKSAGVGVPLYGNTQMFRSIDDEHFLWLDCDLRGGTMWLYSRKDNSTQAELSAVIANIPEVKGMEVQRFCDGSLNGWGSKTGVSKQKCQ